MKASPQGKQSTRELKRKKTIYFIFLFLLCLSINHATACSVWTDKSNYNPGETVTIFYQLDVNCNVELQIIRYDGAQFTLYSGLASAGTNQYPGMASEPCGTRTIILNVFCEESEDSGGSGIPISFSGSGSSDCTSQCTFNVVCAPTPTPEPRPECTNTYRCSGNIVQRLCYENGREYWQDYDNCNNYNQPCDCINNMCVERTPTPPKPTCNQQACQGQNKAVGQPYSMNGAIYQRFMVCNCIGDGCQCNQVEREVPCTGIISGGAIEANGGMPIAGVPVYISGGKSDWKGTTDAKGAFRSSQLFCPSTTYRVIFDKMGYLPNMAEAATDASGNAIVTIPLTADLLGDVKFRGEVLHGGMDDPQIISIHHFAIRVTEILENSNNRLSIGAIVGVTSHRSGPARVDTTNNGDQVEVYGKGVLQSIESTYFNYSSNVELSGSTSDGAKYYLTKLKPKCSGLISGHAYDSTTRSPIPGATLLICPSGGDCWSPAPVDSTGLYSSGASCCPSTSYEITCSAEGYKSSTLPATTDENGNAWRDFQLEPDCQGEISGHVFDSKTRSPLAGATLLICKYGGDCWSPAPVDSTGLYSSGKQACPLTSYEITCSAEGYKSSTLTVPADEKGNAWNDFPLEHDCQGMVSGTVLDTSNSQPISGANLLVCQNGKCFDPISTDSLGQYSIQGFCPSASYEITCSAEGYKTITETDITDDNGDSSHSIHLEKECNLEISGEVKDAHSNQPVPGANLLICQNGKCYDPVITDPSGQYSSKGFCPLTSYEITCSAQGYKTAEEQGTSGDMGNLPHDFLLEADCQGMISGIVKDGHSDMPVPGASINLCRDGVCYDPKATDSSGQYSFVGCPSTSYGVTCFAPGYKENQGKINTDEEGNAVHDMQLEPGCMGTISGKILNSLTDEPVQGAKVSICQEIYDKCSESVITDSAGQFIYSKGCPSMSYKIICSADGYQTHEDSSVTKEDGSSLQEILLEPECKGTITGKVLNVHNGKPVQGATVKFCVNSQCFGPVVTDSTGEYSKDGCPFTSYNVICSAQGYKDNQGKTKTDENGNAVYEIQLEPDCQGKISGVVKDAHTDKPVQGASIKLCHDGSCYEPKQSDTTGQYSFIGCPSTDYQITCTSPGYGSYENTGKTDEKGNGAHDIQLDSNLSLKIWTDSTSYKAGEEITIHYETGIEDAARRIIVSCPGIPTTTFGENTFQNETKGIRNLTLNKPGEYEAKLEAWTARDRQEAKCQFEVVENNRPTINSIKATPASPQQLFAIKIIGMVHISARASDPDKDPLQYKFELRNKGEDFQVTRDWEALPLWVWYPEDSGEYQIRVEVTDGKSEASQTINYNITNRVPSVWLNIEPAVQASVGDKVSCQANAFDLDSDSIQYKFWLKGPSTNNQWQSKTDWVKESKDGFFGQHKWSWTPGAADVGKNEINVWVRDGSHAGPQTYDANNVSSYEVIGKAESSGAQLEITSLKASPQSPQDVQKSPRIMWTVQASNPAKDVPKYQFELRKKGGEFKVAKEFAAMPLWTWEPEEAGEYEIKAVVQNSKGQTATRVADYSITDINNKKLSLIIKNAGGHSMPAKGGTLDVYIFDDKSQKEKLNLKSKENDNHIEQKYLGGEEEVAIGPIKFQGDSLFIIIFNRPRIVEPFDAIDAPDELRECWGYATFNQQDIQDGAEFTRNMPWIESINGKGIISLKNDNSEAKRIFLKYNYNSYVPPIYEIVGTFNWDGLFKVANSEDGSIEIPAESEVTSQLTSSNGIKNLEIGDILYIYTRLYVEKDNKLSEIGIGQQLVDQWEWTINPDAFSFKEANALILEVESLKIQLSIINQKCQIMSNNRYNKEELNRIRREASADYAAYLEEYLEKESGHSNPIVKEFIRNLAKALKEENDKGTDEQIKNLVKDKIVDDSIPVVNLITRSISRFSEMASISLDNENDRYVAAEFLQKQKNNPLVDLSNGLDEELVALQTQDPIKLQSAINYEDYAINEINDLLNSEKVRPYAGSPIASEIDYLVNSVLVHKKTLNEKIRQ